MRKARPQAVQTRRSFLKGFGAAGLVATTSLAIAGCAGPNAPEPSEAGSEGAEGQPASTAPQTQAAAAPEETVGLTVCRGACTQHCRLEAVVRDGKLVRTRAAQLSDADDARICAKGSSWPNTVYSNQRIQYPCRRVGERGSGEWERISWEEAIDEICSKLSGIIAEYGGAAVAVAYEGGNLAPSGQGAHARWVSLIGGSKIGCNDDQAFIQTMSLHTGGSPDPSTARNIIMFGSSQPMTSPQDYRYISDALSNGAKLISVNPCFEPLSAKADTYVPVRPGTDAALAMSMIRYIEENGLADEAYLKTMTVAPFLVKASDGKFLRLSDIEPDTPQESDTILAWDSASESATSAYVAADPALRGSFTVGDLECHPAYQLLIDRVEPFTTEKAARICDLDPSLIEQVAQAAAEGSAIYQGRGTDHWGNALGSNMAIIALALVTGGIKLLPAASAPMVYWPLSGFTLAEDEAGHNTLAPHELSPFMLHPLVTEGKCELPGTVIEQPIKAVMFMSGGKMSSTPDYNRTIEMIKAADLYVTADINWGDNARYADIVLPASTQFEFNDLMNSGKYIVYCEQSIQPLYESKPDFEIACLIAKGLGLGEWFDGMGNDDLLQITVDGNPTLLGMGMTIPDLKKMRFMAFDTAVTPETFYTQTGRAPFYLEQPYAMKYYGQTFDAEKIRLPYFEPPVEAWTQTVDEYEKNPLADTYPLIYWTAARRLRTHAHFNSAENLMELNRGPCVYVNPADAKARNVADGDKVRLFNERGHVVATCVYNEGMRPGIVDMDRGWQFGQYSDDGSHYNALTHTTMAEPACYNHAFYDVLCQMEKA